MKQNFYSKFSYRIFGNLALQYMDHFDYLKADLKKSDVRIALPEYLSIAFMSSTLIFIILVPIISITIGIVVGGLGGVISGLIASFFVGVSAATGVFTFFYIYPSIKVNARRRNIDHNLPFATMYLATLTGSGTPPFAIFDILGKFDEYGEISKEARRISRDIHSFGADVGSALKRAADRTASEDFRELLWAMNTIIRTGGDLRIYLHEKSRSLMNKYRRELDKFTATLSLLVEIYITLVIVGSVFLMVLSTIMGPLNVESMIVVIIQVLGVFLFLPLASIVFIVMIKGISPID